MAFASGRRLGSSERRSLSKPAPPLVRVGNFDLMMEPCAEELWEGRRSDRAFGRRLKPGQLSSVGMPHISKICVHVNER